MKALFLAVFVLTTLTLGANAEQITSCTVIDSPGYYVLTNDIINSSETYCINIQSNDVIFDGNGYIIDGVDSGYGIYVYGSLTSPYTNITIKNVAVTDWINGIYFYRVKNGSIINTTATSNRFGISVYSSENIAIANNKANRNSDDGIRIYSSNNNTAVNNDVSSNSRNGFYIYNSNYNVISNNNVSSCYTGINLYSSDNNSITDNKANSNSWYGIDVYRSNSNFVFNNSVKFCKQGLHLYYAEDNVIAINRAESNTWDGMYIAYSWGNTIASNTVSSNSRHGIWLYSSNDNTLLGNKIEENGEDDKNYGIYIYSSASNLIYNNLFRNRYNVGFGGIIYSNSWNVTKTEGINVIGGSYIGGNYWSNPSGNGFSDTCSDANSDGICDMPYRLDGDVDSFPLTQPSQYYTLKLSTSSENSIVEDGTYKLRFSISSGKSVQAEDGYAIRMIFESSSPNFGTEKHVGLSEPLLVSCDYTGFEKNSFVAGERVCVEGFGLLPNTEYKIWIQPDPVSKGETLDPAKDPSGRQEIVQTDEYGNFGPVCIWTVSHLPVSEWDIIADKRGEGEGMYGPFDAIDDASTSGFAAPIPEVITLALTGAGVAITAVIARARRYS